LKRSVQTPCSRQDQHHEVGLSSVMQAFRPRRVVGGGGSMTAFIINMSVATAVGILSGHYIFKEPIEQYWKEHAHLLSEEKRIQLEKQNEPQRRQPPSQ
jgi:hypothetical protein